MEYLNNIVIFDKSTTQTGFFDSTGHIRNGACILCPTVCTCTKELNGIFELYIELINPDSNTLKHIACWSYVAAPVTGKWDSSGKAFRKHQIFYISSIEKVSGESGVVNIKIYATHIFYVLALKQMPASEWSGIRSNLYFRCDDAMRHFSASNAFTYDVGATDIPIEQKFELSSDSTYVSAIMDDYGILQKYKAELHRDNFYFSGKKQKEFSSGSATSPAFRFLYGKEIRGITEYIDYTGVVTTLRIPLIDQKTTRILSVHPEKIGMKYTCEKYYSTSAKTDDERIKNATEYFETVNHPQISYVLVLNEMNESYEYSDISGLKNCDVGDVGTVYTSSIGVNTVQKITKTVENVLIGEYTEITLGNVQGSISRVSNATAVIGAETTDVNFEECAGFTAEIAVTDGKNQLHLSSYDYQNAANQYSYDTYVDFGDTYTAFMSELPQKTITHKYAYNGDFKLEYTVYGNMLHGEVYGPAIVGAGASDIAVTADNIVFNNNTTEIGEMNSTVPVFSGCTSIMKVTIPDSVRYISIYAFSYCVNLTDIYYSGTIGEWTKIAGISDPYSKGWQNVYDITVHCANGDTIQSGSMGTR